MYVYEINQFAICDAIEKCKLHDSNIDTNEHLGFCMYGYTKDINNTVYLLYNKNKKSLL